MRGCRAKAIRKRVYGDNAHKNTMYRRDAAGTLRCSELRSEYQKAKTDWKRRNR